MAKISEERRLHFSETISPYKEKVNQTLEKEKTMLNGMHEGDMDFENKNVLLCEDMIYAASLYMAQNSLSEKVLNVKNNEVTISGGKIKFNHGPNQVGKYEYSVKKINDSWPY